MITHYFYHFFSFSDPHFQTYDGTSYSFHGECDLVMARSTKVGNTTGIDIHARTTKVDNWSLISNAAIKVGEDVFEIVNDNTVYLNGVKDVAFPLLLDGKYIVSKHEEVVNKGEVEAEIMVIYSIELDNGEVKVSNWRKMLTVDVNAAMPDTEGMMGSQTMVGMVGRDRQTVLTDANEMGAQWQVRDFEPQLFNEVRAPQYPAKCNLPTVTSRRLRISENEQKSAQAACADVPASRRHFCVEDLLLSGDAKIAHGYRVMGSAHAV
jgi:hypothetical protein